MPQAWNQEDGSPESREASVSGGQGIKMSSPGLLALRPLPQPPFCSVWQRVGSSGSASQGAWSAGCLLARCCLGDSLAGDWRVGWGG